MKALYKPATLATICGIFFASYTPAQSVEVEWDNNVVCTATGQEVEGLTEQVCRAMKEAALSIDLGSPVVTQSSSIGVELSSGEKQRATIYRLDTYYFSQQFERGWLVYEMSTGLVVPMSQEVYAVWGSRDSDEFRRNVEKYGAVADYKISGDEITTQFLQMNGKRIYLRYLPEAGKVMDVTAEETGQDALGWQQSLSLGGGVDGINAKDYIAQGLTDAGYEPTIAGDTSGGFAYNGGFGSLYDQVVKQQAVLPVGTPWIINLSAAPADAQRENRQQAISNAQRIVSELQRAYPHSKIVLNGILSRDSDREANTFNEELAELAQRAGVGFVDTSGWISAYGLENQVITDGHDLSAAGQQKIAVAMKWAIRKAIAKKTPAESEPESESSQTSWLAGLAESAAAA